MFLFCELTTNSIIKSYFVLFQLGHLKSTIIERQIKYISMPILK